MSDLLLELSKNPQTRKLIQTLGLPLPLPQALERAKGPAEERPLQGRAVIVGAAAPSLLTPIIAKTLAAAGGDPWLFGTIEPKAFADAGEAWGHPAKTLTDVANAPSAHALVFDGTTIDTPEKLRALYDFFHPLVGTLRRSGRVVVLGRAPEDVEGVAAQTAQAGLEGFVRSLAKEIGRKGATANLLRVDADAASRLVGPLRWLLSARSAFVTAQPLRVSLTAAPAGATEAETPWVRPLEGKTVLVTGAARGIGEATVKLLAAEGAKVIVLDRPADDAPASLVARSIGGSVLLADVSDPEAPKKIAQELKERHGGVDVVVHNAGVVERARIEDTSEAAWDHVLDVNLKGPYLLTHALLPRMRAR
ncbi:MAG TPA: SDR family oxidoreductase, partial [Polyangia bacterium]|nr:SDR family oxidoreductase [Polyangia bacterium]